MPKKTGPTDPNLRELIQKLKKRKDLKKLASALAKPRRKKENINLFEIDRISEGSKDVVVTGKVLGVGDLKSSKNIYAWRFSKSAKDKIVASGGKCYNLEDLLSKKTVEAKIL